ncbi:hypothetical protein ACFQ0G_49050 [Streptomyces chiangmaiensis]
MLNLDRVGVHDNFYDLGGTAYGLATVHAGCASTPADSCRWSRCTNTHDGGAGPPPCRHGRRRRPAPDGPTTAQQNTRLRAGRTRLRQRRLRQQ